MDLDDLTKIAFSIIKDDDPYKESKQLQMRNWGRGYLETINTGNISFFLDILSDKECWEKTDTIHGIKLNRRLVAKKVIEPQSWKGTSNPLKDFYLYQIACWCCLEEDIISLFEHFKQEDKIKEGDSDALKKLVKSVSGSWCTDAMMQFWSHFISGYISELDLKGQHPYVFGLHRAAISSRRRRVEAVEFFWDKVNSLPESELSTQEKDEVFMRIAVHAAHDNGYPDVFEFCLSQISPNKYPELLKRDLEKNGYYGSISRMMNVLNFGKVQELFDCLKLSEISEDCYHTLLYSIKIQNYSGHYVDAAKELFLHIWTKEEFDTHSTFVINKEVMDSSFSHTNLLVRWVKKGIMEPVWVILDKLDSNQIKEFMTYKQADYIRSVLEQGDNQSLNKFLGYGKSTDEELDQKNIPGPSGDLAEVEISKQSYVGLGDH
ncbi:hypothetical protein HGO48_05380 [Wolbachia endosymbiont of Diaphorina citri]|uniref:hypothetical protein n=1 Tax=Wolbachia endosymbiont of Diaphorina citri TaxID=116598 RepID=UPI00155EE535|nr:hypothetical protein [Wolbachia endosymbiont of Diaphorina citri]QJT94775.1 hypothetical protein HGO48_05380 [Wolbachia endosymbiont of Diaphorina citri]QLK11671.1 hypothetical protein FK497_05440 [Wolbachia endosymbiont of Diaphorina citri]